MSQAHPSVLVAVPAIRRRRIANAPREKTSLSIRADVLKAAREIVESGQAENLSALVEIALEEKVKRTKRAALYAAYEMASQNLDFMRELDSVSKAFDVAAQDGL